MFNLAFESALRSIIKTPGVSLLVTLTIALGVGITMPMVTLYHNNSGNPIPEVGHKMYRVLIDNWFVDGVYWTRDPNMPTEIMAARDIRNLIQSDIPNHFSASYSGYQHVRSVDENSNVKPFYTDVRATTHGFFDMFQVPIEYGSFWDAEADKKNQNIAVISHPTNLKLFGGGDNVGKSFKLGNQVYTIVGITSSWALAPRVYDMSQNNARPEGVFVPLSDFQRTNLRPNRWRTLEEKAPEGFEATFVNSETIFALLWVQLNTPEKVLEYRDFLDSYVAEQKALGRLPRPTNNRLYSAEEWVVASPGNDGTQRLYRVFIVVGVFFLIVCLLNLLSLLLSKFVAATPQACVMRALGATRGLIFTQYVIEVAILGVIGGVLSVFVARGALQAILWVYLENLPAEFKQIQSSVGADNPYVQFDSTLLMITLTLALIGSMLSALYPAWRACRIPPAEFLKVN